MQNNPARYITDYVFNKHITMISEEFLEIVYEKKVCLEKRSINKFKNLRRNFYSNTEKKKQRR